MANSLMDLFSGSQQQPQDNLQQGGGISGMSNSLVGLGMGLLQPYNPWAGTNAWSNALQGYQTGAALDQRTKQQQQQLAMEQARLKLAQQSANREPEAIRQLRAAGVPQEKWADYLYPKQDEWKAGEVTEREQAYPYRANLRTGQYEWGPMGPPPSLAQRQQRAAPAPAGVPFTGGDPFGTGPTGALAPAPQAAVPAPIASGGPSGTEPPKPPGYDTWLPSVQKEYDKKIADLAAQSTVPKPLTAHEQSTIEKADDLVEANKQAKANLEYAKQLSPKALSGPLVGASEAAGSAFPQFMSEQTKNTMLLRNAVTVNAVTQLRAIFGGNPTEGERKVLIDLQGSINQPDAVRQEIFNRASQLADERMQQNLQRSQQIRGGTYYKPGGGPTGAPSQSNDPLGLR